MERLEYSECLERIEVARGKRTTRCDATDLARLMAGHADVLIDLGCGDGRYVRQVAAACSDILAIGVDACRDGLRGCSRDAPPNALYVVANALALLPVLDGTATRVTVNFPWGSLLAGLLDEGSGLPGRLAALARPGTPGGPGATLEVRLNAGALAEQGRALDEGGRRIRRALVAAGFDVRPPEPMGAAELRAFPSTWARRLAFGRDPRALLLRGRLRR